MFIVFSDNCENFIECLYEQGRFLIWRSVYRIDDNIFPLGDNSFDQDRLNYLWVRKFAFLQNFIFTIVL